jgi:peptidoglycan hydrolase-like protein with peptidoglycan-binding domain
MNLRTLLLRLVAPLALLGLFLPALAFAQFNRELGIGSRGQDVALLQAYLAGNPALYPEGLVTGYFGPLTEKAVARWQAMTNVTGDAAGYVGPISLALLNQVPGIGAGTSVPTTIIPGVGGSVDTTAPSISNISIATTRTSATISWRTDEDANSKVLYGFNWPFTSAVERTSISGFGTAHQVTLTGLMPNTTYFYLLESEDISGNVVWYGGHTFTTQP